MKELQEALRENSLLLRRIKELEEEAERLSKHASKIRAERDARPDFVKIGHSNIHGTAFYVTTKDNITIYAKKDDVLSRDDD